MSVWNDFFEKHIPREHLSQLTEREYVLIERRLLLTILGEYSYSQWLNFIKCLPRPHDVWRELRSHALSNYELNTTYKIGVINYLIGKGKAPDKVKWLPKIMPRTKQKIINKLEFSNPSLKEQAEIVDQVLRDTEGWTTRFVYKKMSFFINANRMSHLDVIHDLQLKAIQVARQCYPFKSREYIFNTCKRAIHNSGINEIKKQTTQKSGRLQSNQEVGFFNVERMLVDNDQEIADTPFSSIENSMWLDNLLGIYSGKKKQALEILTGNCKHFAFWIQQKFGLDSDEYLEKVGLSQLKVLIARYLHWQVEYLEQFLQQLAYI